MGTPWSLRIGMMLSVAGNPTEVYVTKQIKPAGFYDAYQEKKKKKKKKKKEPMGTPTWAEVADGITQQHPKGRPEGSGILQ